MSEIKGRGAQKKTGNKFLKNSYHHHLDWDYENDEPSKTRLFFESPKEIVNKVLSPDVPMGFSINPYQGCEHGCVYCYARNSHQYWGFGAGLEFEQNIIIKKNAPELLRKKFNTKAWKGDPFGNLLFKGTARNFNPVMAMAGKVTIAEVEELVEPGELNPNTIHTPGVFVQRIFQGESYEKRIEQRTSRTR